MKKIALILTIGVLVSAATAELYKPHRIVEFGVDAEAGASNNHLKITDYLKKNLVIDLQKFSDDMPNKGLEFDFMTHEKIFLNVNASEKFRLGFYVGVEGSGYGNIPKNLFDVLGSGYHVGEKLSADIEGYADVFADIGVTFRTKLFGQYGVTINPAYFMPVMYVDNAKATVEVTSTADGRIRAEARAPIDVYSSFDLQPIVDNDGINVGDIISKSMGNGGFDLALAVERPVLNSLELGAFTRIPMVPAKMTHKMTTNMYAYYTVNNILGNLLGTSDDSAEESDSDYGVDDIVYSNDESKRVWRPFRLGVEGAWRPFGNWFTVRPMLALVVRNPYTSGMRQVYPEYGLDVEATLFNILGLNLGTGYENKTFVQRLGVMMNFRVFELNAKAMFRSGSFANSFGLRGMGAYVGIRFGF